MKDAPYPAVLGEDAGFASIDALTALTLLAISIALSLQCVNVARRLGEQGVEIGQAERLARSVMDSTSAEPGDAVGRTGGFQWRYHSEFTGSPGATAQHFLCARSTSLQSTGGQTYGLTTLSICGGNSGR